MFGSEIFEIVLGLAFIYVLLSLLATIANEFILTMINARGKTLRIAIESMLDDQDEKRRFYWIFGVIRNKMMGLDRVFTFIKKFFGHPGEAIKMWQETRQTTPGWSEKVFSNPFFKKLRKPGSARFPSYLSSDNFSRILIEELASAGSGDTDFDKIKEYLTYAVNQKKQKPVEKSTESSDKELLESEDTARVLLCLLKESKGSVDQFKLRVERWYDDVMNRATGWYKRRTQITILVIGMLVSIGLNADSIQIALELKNNPQARSQLIEMAVKYTENKDSISPEVRENVDAIITDLNKLVKEDIESTSVISGMGWESADVAYLPRFIPKCFRKNELPASAQNGFPQWFFLKLIGLLFTSLAISLGAPFWFDLLKQLVNLRGSGRAASDGASRVGAVG